jgi:hypothetical protein
MQKYMGKKWPEKAIESVQREIENDWISALSLVKYTLYMYTLGPLVFLPAIFCEENKTI